LSYIEGFSTNVQRIFEYFEFENELEKMREANILFLTVSKFCDVDLHPDRVPNEQMGLIFENLIRRFNELANETAGDHFHAAGSHPPDGEHSLHPRRPGGWPSELPHVPDAWMDRGKDKVPHAAVQR
jgi:hypothetical protein